MRQGEDVLKDNLYAAPRLVTDIRDCAFYHSMNIPNYGEVFGDWDLRGLEHRYLGGVDFRGKRVLEMGTASGFFCFFMERLGAEVVSFDLSEDFSWDVVPFAGSNHQHILAERREAIRKLNNGYWLAHRAYCSKARVVYGNIYDLPMEIGPVDIATFGSILPHLQNPFLALQKALALTKETVIVSETIWNRYLLNHILSYLTPAQATFVPRYRTLQNWDTWWYLPPPVVKNYLGVLGFHKTSVRYFFNRYHGRRRLAYVLVGRR
ncbi:MAG TPA: class I SAM-dependent methyltransferase [Methanomassiliicoccales archaeon]|nr:class I SAM-dependent methyltransferase [Methanomassiliicoccales archaeon]